MIKAPHGVSNVLKTGACVVRLLLPMLAGITGVHGSVRKCWLFLMVRNRLQKFRIGRLTSNSRGQPVVIPRSGQHGLQCLNRNTPPRHSNFKHVTIISGDPTGLDMGKLPPSPEDHHQFGFGHTSLKNHGLILQPLRRKPWLPVRVVWFHSPFRLASGAFTNLPSKSTLHRLPEVKPFPTG